MDPLSVLRDFNTNNKLQIVQQVGGNVQFGDRYNFPASTPVYKAAGAAAVYYTLQDVLFYLKSRQLKPQEYVMAASQAGVSNINIVDRKCAHPGPPDEANALRALLEQERQLRNRNTMLLAPNKDFRRVLEVVSNVRKLAAQQQAAARAATATAAAGKAPASSSGKGHAAAAVGQDGRAGGSSSRYGRDSTADQLKAMAPGAGGALAINMYGTSGKAAPAPPPPPPSGAAGYVPVRKSGGAAGAAPPPPPPPPGSSSSQPAHRSGSSQQPSGHGSSKHGSSKAGHGAAAAAKGGAPGAAGGKGDAKKGGSVPIIIVPSGLTSLINMYNAKAFLEEGRFMTTAQAQAASGGAPKPSSQPIRRTAHRPAPGVEYHITDKPPSPSSPDWERVVAVLVQGAKWQFKDWPHKGAKDGDLVEAFSKVCGFFVHYSDEKVVAPVCDWNVTLVPLHRENRHKDMTAMLGLFARLDTFLQSKRSTLTY
ncbi:hypothetical protein GPECTOR_27g642 [Gonium pectorale]|uniref:Cell division control protein 73 C-terminal domain-containing protein n=1 Tax=Gonium pectorale TaxID=33097 RepID=A0A150GF51_GONPE|nr:hypothetical protein GPECTOR_27g642 [Gonium pectorale]|eukprot:KXZ48472.1 hypothetical protein GPECTOR_27g642 [Gonium pectorale]